MVESPLQFLHNVFFLFIHSYQELWITRIFREILAGSALNLSLMRNHSFFYLQMILLYYPTY